MEEKQAPHAKIWVDGCFDFTHHGHSGALMQARQFGNELFVGVHSDEDIKANKGPVVMSLDERIKSVEACKWVTQSVPGAPYVTDPKVMDDWGCQFVVHGDDITTDADGNDCYQIVKDLGRFLVVKRTPNISTTDLIQRMLSTSTAHHLNRISAADTAHPLLQNTAIERITSYATDETALNPHSGVYAMVDGIALQCLVAPSAPVEKGLAKSAYYIDGSFDLFHVGHIECLAAVHKRAQEDGAMVIVGIHDDDTVNQGRGENYPIMNIFERTLCVLQCRYVDAVVIGAPFLPTPLFIDLLKQKGIEITRVFHGYTDVVTNHSALYNAVDPYQWAKEKNMYEQLPATDASKLTTKTIVDRVLDHRRMYEDRQRKKGVKAVNERRMAGQ